MAIYVDNANILWKGKRRFHMTADTLKELHEFAEIINVSVCWFDSNKKHPHYDINEIQKINAIEKGALLVSSKTIVKIAKKIK